MKFIINEELAGRRLDTVAGALTRESRAWAQKMIKNNLLTINGVMVKANYQLKDGDKLAIAAAPNMSPAVKQAAWPVVPVIAETADYLVVNKPAGLLVHAAAGKPGELTLADWLLKHYPPIKKVGEGPERPGIVHRLDREVSGLLVVAKKPAAFLSLKEQFKNRSMVKEYQALVYGSMATDSGSINFLLTRSKNGGKIAARPLNQTGREAWTEFRVDKHFINYTYLKVRIKTGRTHQIRAHLAAVGHPLVGDDLYGTKMTRLKNKKINLGRIFLVSTRLGFTDLAGEKQEFKTDLPRELKKLLKTVK